MNKLMNSSLKFNLSQLEFFFVLKMNIEIEKADLSKYLLGYLQKYEKWRFLEIGDAL
jgi:hypothetical protein